MTKKTLVYAGLNSERPLGYLECVNVELVKKFALIIMRPWYVMKGVQSGTTVPMPECRFVFTYALTSA